MRVLVSGDREWTDEAMVLVQMLSLYREHGDDLVFIHGDAKGADRCCENVCRRHEIPRLVAPAPWNRFKSLGKGNGAGPWRNRWMLKHGNPDLLLAFHDDLEHSKGTKDMVQLAEAAGIPVRRFSHERVL